MSKQWRVSYVGFLGPVTRTFPTMVHATQWARKVGVYNRATIEKLNHKPNPADK